MKVKKIQKVVTDPRWILERDGVTQGFINSFLECREQTRLKFVEGWTTNVVSQALMDGHMGHAVLGWAYEETMLKGAPSGIPDRRWLTQALNTFETEWIATHSNLRSDDYDVLYRAQHMLMAILPSYFEHWKEDFSDKTQWESTEATFSVGLRAGPLKQTVVPMRGRYDGVLRRGSARRLWLFETKFKSTIDEDEIVDILPLDTQCMLYLWSLRLTHGEMPQGVIYNVVRRPQLRQKKHESVEQLFARIRKEAETNPDKYFMRLEMEITEEELLTWKRKFLVPVVNEIHRWARHAPGSHYMTPAALRSRYGRAPMYRMIARDDMNGYTRRKIAFMELEEEF